MIKEADMAHDAKFVIFDKVECDMTRYVCREPAWCKHCAWASN